MGCNCGGSTQRITEQADTARRAVRAAAEPRRAFRERRPPGGTTWNGPARPKRD